MSEHGTSQPNTSSGNQGQPPSNTTPKPASAPKPQNAAFRAIGLPNWRLRLPSRNWTIFLTIVGSFSGAVYYDRRQKKAVQKKWCTLVEHVAQESLPTSTLPRRVTIVLSAPPGDGIRVAREHFTEYVKPILVAGALDWDVIEGRREGEVRAGLANRVRKLRKLSGEQSTEPLEPDISTALMQVRDRNGVGDPNGPKGDIVIGRHTWKEYIRGLHEGWLGPIDPPPPPSPESSLLAEPDQQATLSQSTDSQPSAATEASSENENSTSDASATSSSEAKAEKKPEKPKKLSVPLSFNQPSSYSESPLPASCPETFQPSAPIALPHILGIRHTPKRMYRFLTRRHLADEVGRQTAAAVLAAHRPYHSSKQPSNSASEGRAVNLEQHDNDMNGALLSSQTQWEQQDVLATEEPEWSKKQRKREDGEGERVWLDSIVIDPRIGERMRKFELADSEGDRVQSIAKGASRPSAKPDADGDDSL